MKVTEMWTKKKPTVSFEFFPARNAEAGEKLNRVIEQLAVMEPDFVSVTFGAGGSTREGSRQLVTSLKNDLKLEVMAYFAGYGLGPEDIRGVLDSYQVLGVENVLVVRGDPPHGEPILSPTPGVWPMPRRCWNLFAGAIVSVWERPAIRRATLNPRARKRPGIPEAQGG